MTIYLLQRRHFVTFYVILFVFWEETNWHRRLAKRIAAVARISKAGTGLANAAAAAIHWYFSIKGVAWSLLTPFKQFLYWKKTFKLIFKRNIFLVLDSFISACLQFQISFPTWMLVLALNTSLYMTRAALNMRTRSKVPTCTQRLQIFLTFSYRFVSSPCNLSCITYCNSTNLRSIKSVI